MLSIRKPVIVKSLGGVMKADRICPKVSLNIKGKNFQANLIVLELMDIDVILGKGWLSACKGVIKYSQHSVLLTTLSGERIEYEGIQPAPEEYENDLLEGVYSEDVYHVRVSSFRVVSFAQLIRYWIIYEEWLHLSIWLCNSSYPQLGVQSSTYLGQVGVDDIGMRYLITTDGSIESQKIPKIY